MSIIYNFLLALISLMACYFFSEKIRSQKVSTIVFAVIIISASVAIIIYRTTALPKQSNSNYTTSNTTQTINEKTNEGLDDIIKSATNGNIELQLYLGELYFSERKYESCIFWLNIAAHQTISKKESGIAFNNLGYIYSTSADIQDLIKAEEYYIEAINNNDELAVKNYTIFNITHPTYYTKLINSLDKSCDSRDKDIGIFLSYLMVKNIGHNNKDQFQWYTILNFDEKKDAIKKQQCSLTKV